MCLCVIIYTLHNVTVEERESIEYFPTGGGRNIVFQFLVSLYFLMNCLAFPRLFLYFPSRRPVPSVPSRPFRPTFSTRGSGSPWPPPISSPKNFLKNSFGKSLSKLINLCTKCKNQVETWERSWTPRGMQYMQKASKILISNCSLKVTGRLCSVNPVD